MECVCVHNFVWFNYVRMHVCAYMLRVCVCVCVVCVYAVYVCVADAPETRQVNHA